MYSVLGIIALLWLPDPLVHFSRAASSEHVAPRESRRRATPKSAAFRVLSPRAIAPYGSRSFVWRELIRKTASHFFGITHQVRPFD